MYRVSNAFMHKIMQDDIDKEMDEKYKMQLNSLGGYQKIFPIDPNPAAEPEEGLEEKSDQKQVEETV